MWKFQGRGDQKIDVLNRAGVWFKNAMAHLTLSLKYFFNKYTLLESTSLRLFRFCSMTYHLIGIPTGKLS
jgi:hypothetical protein